MNEAIIVAVISGLCTLCGTFYGIRRSNSLTDYRLDELRKEVEKHNQVITRVYDLERGAAVLDNRVRVQEHRMEDVEKKLDT